MFYAIHETDQTSNTPGKIVQGNKVYDPAGYDDRLKEMGHNYVSKDIPGLLSPDHWYVLLGDIHSRPTMKIKVNKTTIKAGGSDTALIRNIPKQAEYFISTGDVTPWSGVMPDTEMEILIPTPCIYRVIFRLWPYKDHITEIEAIA